MTWESPDSSQTQQTYTCWGRKKVTEDKEAREQPVVHDRLSALEKGENTVRANWEIVSLILVILYTLYCCYDIKKKNYTR